MVKRRLIAYFISDICAKKYQNLSVCQSHSKPKVGRLLRHRVHVCDACVMVGRLFYVDAIKHNSDDNCFFQEDSIVRATQSNCCSTFVETVRYPISNSKISH